MDRIIGLEALEGRTHFATGSVLDRKYVFGEQALADRLGHGWNVFQAVAAPGDRTFLLADKSAAQYGQGDSVLTIIALTGHGKLDPAFGDGGIALTGRVTQPHYAFESPGILKLDNAGRLYFADDSRVLRFRRNGSADRTFGIHGAVTYSDASQPAALCDIVPTDDGVLVAMMKAAAGVERFSVIKTDGRTVATTWSARHDSGLASYDFDGTYYNDDTIPETNLQELHNDQLQFAQSRGGLVLVRVESDQALYFIDAGAESETLPGTTRDDVVVTRFDSDGQGTDVARCEMKRGNDHASSYLGISGGHASVTPFQATVLNSNGRTLLVQGDQEVLKFDLRSGSAHRYALPEVPAGTYPTYRLLSDGNVYVYDGLHKEPNIFYYDVNRFGLDGKKDSAFADNGLLTVRMHDFTGGDNENLEQLFLSTSGRLYFVADSGPKTDVNDVYYHSTLTVRRI